MRLLHLLVVLGGSSRFDGVDVMLTTLEGGAEDWGEGVSECAVVSECEWEWVGNVSEGWDGVADEGWGGGVGVAAAVAVAVAVVATRSVTLHELCFFPLAQIEGRYIRFISILHYAISK